jgi:hypothetical protein
MRPGLVIVVIGGVVVRRLRSPKGMRFAVDGLGIHLIRESDGMDYHPDPSTWMDPAFAAAIRRGMAEKYKRRAERRRAEKIAARNAREAERINGFFERDLPTTPVLLEDSIRAGNCLEGSLRVAEMILRVPRESILAAPHLYSCPAPLLLRAVGANQRPSAQRAVRAAWERDTTISI